MPLLNVDLVQLASSVVPESARGPVDEMSVRARLATLAIVADQGGNTSVRDIALNALTVIDAPAYVGLSAVRIALESSCALLRVPADRFGILVAVVSFAVSPKEGYAEFAKWPRKDSERWLLTVTARDVAKALANR